MNNELAQAHVIDPLKLQSDRYFESLFELAVECGALTAADEDRIKQQFISLAYDLSRMLAGGNSSISIDKFEGLLQSIQYCFSLALKECADPDKAVELLKSESMENLYYAGKAKILKLLSEIKMNRSIIKACKFKTENIHFKFSQGNSLTNFFEKYDYMTAADTEDCVFDYLTYNHIEPLRGVEYMHRREEAAALESRFLSSFENEKIDFLMSNVRFGNEPESFQYAYVNIYQYVLCQALGCEIVLKDPSELYLTSDEIYSIKKLFISMSYDELLQTLNDALDKLAKRLNIDEKALKYAKKSIPQLADDLLINGGQNMQLLFVSDTPDERQQVYDAETLSGEDFVFIVNLLSRTDSDEKKAEIISENIESFADFEEIVRTCDITQSVISLCFDKMKKSLLVLIVYKYMTQYFDPSNPIALAAGSFIQSLDTESKAQLEKIISSIYM